jgi:hypothetical protein
MSSTHVTCDRVEQEALDARYLAGTLSEEEADAFEEHYFGCDRCWSAVQLGLDVRAASKTSKDAHVRPRELVVEHGTASRAAATTRRRWWPVALAASIAIVAVGIWRFGDVSNIWSTGAALRGPADSIRAVASVRGQDLMVSWERKANADRYGVRLQKRDATLILDRAVNDTLLSIARDSLTAVADGERVYWEVRAFDALRRTIAHSSLVPTIIPATRR